MEDYDKLSAESKYLLAQFMKEFYSKIDEGQSRLQAKTIAITLDDVKELVSQAKRDDLKDYIYELSDADFLTHGDGSNEPIEMTLTNKAIVWSQNKVGDNVKKWVELAGKLLVLIKP